MCVVCTTHFVSDMEQSVVRVISDKAIISNRNRTEATNVGWSSLPIVPAVAQNTRGVLYTFISNSFLYKLLISQSNRARVCTILFTLEY